MWCGSRCIRGKSLRLDRTNRGKAIGDLLSCQTQRGSDTTVRNAPSVPGKRKAPQAVQACGASSGLSAVQATGRSNRRVSPMRTLCQVGTPAGTTQRPTQNGRRSAWQRRLQCGAPMSCASPHWASSGRVRFSTDTRTRTPARCSGSQQPATAPRRSLRSTEPRPPWRKPLCLSPRRQSRRRSGGRLGSGRQLQGGAPASQPPHHRTGTPGTVQAREFSSPTATQHRYHRQEVRKPRKCGSTGVVKWYHRFAPATRAAQ